MYKILIKSLLLALPLILYALLSICIDPYEYYGTCKISTLHKKKISRKIDPVLYDLMSYRSDPKDVVIIGDSRAGLLRNNQYLEERFPGNVAVVSIGMATLADEINCLKFVMANSAPKSIVMSIHLGIYNAVNNRDITSKVLKVSNPQYKIMHPFDRSVALAIWGILRQMINDEYNVDNFNLYVQPNMSKDEFWDYQLANVPQKHYARYIYPEKYKNELEELVEQCVHRGIDFRFVIMPSHLDEIMMVDKYNRRKEMERFLDDVSKIAPVYNFGLSNVITKSRDAFSDPYHFVGIEVGNIVAKDIFSQYPEVATRIANGH